MMDLLGWIAILLFLLVAVAIVAGAAATMIAALYEMADDDDCPDCGHALAGAHLSSGCYLCPCEVPV